MTETINKLSDDEVEIVTTEVVTESRQKISKQMLLDEKATLDARLEKVNLYLNEFK